MFATSKFVAAVCVGHGKSEKADCHSDEEQIKHIDVSRAVSGCDSNEIA